MVDWLNFSESSGSGYQLVSVTALPNYGNNRTTGFIVSGNTIVMNIEVEQEAYAITIDPLQYTFDYTGGTHSFTIISGKDWSITNYPSWLTLSALSGGSGTTIITTTAERNETSSMLSSTIVVSNQINSVSSNVYQRYDVLLHSYLKFNILSGGTITFGGKYHGSDAWSYDPKTISYRKNGGEWVSITGTSSTTETINVSTGDYLEFKGDNASYRSGYNGYVNPSTVKAAIGFSGTAHFNIYGNIMSLIDSEDFSELSGFTENNALYYLFGGCKVHDASKLVLPATSLRTSCYRYLFSGCTFLTEIPELHATALADECYLGIFQGCSSLSSTPELPATTLANACYYAMFAGCSSISSTPELPATTLAGNCYYGMFSGTSITESPELPVTALAAGCYSYMFANCTGITTAPVLSSTTLAGSCYRGMFSGCTSLTTAPVLPATTLANSCYSEMFSNCTSLTTAPVLPATALTSYCYYRMFAGCSSLTTAPELPATQLADTCYREMFNGCSSLTEAPELPATTLATSCYTEMFAFCTSLTTAPALPATTLTEYCYVGMFNGCRSLTTAPALPATSLNRECYAEMFMSCSGITTAPVLPAPNIGPGCYIRMFQNCSNLNYIKCLATDRIQSLTATADTAYWVSGVASTGTFVKPDAPRTSWWSGDSGIPKNWTVVKE